jgi:hypothetical protein
MTEKGFKQESYRAWMTIDVPGYSEPIELNITRLSAQFGLNAIPQASCSIALGAFVGNTSYVSNLHFIIEKIKYRAKATVYMNVAEGYEAIPPGVEINRDAAFNGKAFVVFEGYTSGSGYKRSGSAVEYVISLEHWLSDLNNSTALSPDLMPGIPFNLYFPATSSSPEASKEYWTARSLAANTFQDEVIRQDVWKGMKDYFTAIANQNQVGGTSNPIFGAGSLLNPNIFKTKKNDAALAALEKFATPGSAFYVPLKLNGEVSTGETLRRIADVFFSKTLTTFDGSTFWDNIVTFSASFLFGISPGISTAWIVPRLPNYRKPYKTIYSTEINNFDISTGMPKFVSGVILKGNFVDGSGVTNINNQNNASPASALNLFSSGMYFSDRHFTDPGMIIIQKSPDWLAVSLTSADIENVIMPRKPADIKNNVDVAARGKDQITALTAFAKLVYSTEVLKYRGGSLTGKFRLDIAPGSIVKIETAGEKVLNKDGFAYPIFASVDQVSLAVDSVSGQASTSFAISNVRSEIENADNDLTTETSPMYSNVWPGAPLYVGN